MDCHSTDAELDGTSEYFTCEYVLYQSVVPFWCLFFFFFFALPSLPYLAEWITGMTITI
jgi:hypothetical protein